MTQTVTAIAPGPSVQAAPRGGRDAAAVAANPSPPASRSDDPASSVAASAEKAALAAPPPLKLSVVKGDNGVFVYTLTDPGSGAVVAVIPRANMQTDGTGTQVDQKV